MTPPECGCRLPPRYDSAQSVLVLAELETTS